MANKYLNNTGLSYLATKIKALLANKADIDLTNVDDYTFLEKAQAAGAVGTPIVSATSTDGATYTSSVAGVTALATGLTITIIPDTTSTTTLPKLNVNSLGEKSIKQSLTANTTTTVQAENANWLQANKPVMLQYDGSQWKTVGSRTNANDMYGITAIEHGGTGADNAADALTNLGAVAKAGDTMTGALVAANDTAYTTYKVRNAAILSAVPSSMSNGTIAFVYG